LRKCALARADLDHVILFAGGYRIGNAVDHTVISEKILAETLTRSMSGGLAGHGSYCTCGKGEYYLLPLSAADFW